MILNYKFNTMLDEARGKVRGIWFKIQIKTWQNKNKLPNSNNNQNKDLEIIIQELKDYEKVAGTLIGKLDGIDTALNKEKEAHEMYVAVRTLGVISLVY